MLATVPSICKTEKMDREIIVATAKFCLEIGAHRFGHDAVDKIVLEIRIIVLETGNSSSQQEHFIFAIFASLWRGRKR